MNLIVLAMVIGNLVYERALTQYMVVQTVGLIVMNAFVLSPRFASRRRGESPLRPKGSLRGPARRAANDR